MNTLIRKGYLLAGVIMAANMFVVNEMKASTKFSQKLVEDEKNGKGATYVDENLINESQYEDPSLQLGQNFIPPTQANVHNSNNIPSYLPTYQKTSMQTVPLRSSNRYNELGKRIISEEDPSYERIKGKKGKNGGKSGGQGSLRFLLYWEKAINFCGGALFTLANSYYKFYENKPGFYYDYYFAGWNSNPFAKGYLQFCPNINLGRGISWSIPHIINFKRILTTRKTIGGKGTEGNKDTNSNAGLWIPFLFQGILPGFVSMPLTVHLSNFSISISLDSIIWAVIDKILELKDKKELEKLQNNPFLNQLINNDDTETGKFNLTTKEQLTQEQLLTDEQLKEIQKEKNETNKDNKDDQKTN